MLRCWQVLGCLHLLLHLVHTHRILGPELLLLLPLLFFYHLFAPTAKRKHEKLATLLSKKLHDKVANTLKMWGCHLLEKVAVLGVLGPCFLREQDVDSYACVLRCRQAWFLLTSSDPFLAFIQYLYKNQCWLRSKKMGPRRIIYRKYQEKSRQLYSKRKKLKLPVRRTDWDQVPFFFLLEGFQSE